MPTRISKLLRRFLIPLAGGMGISLVVSLVSLARPEFMEIIQLKFYDLLIESHVAHTPSGIPVFLDIDDQSLRTYGQWPWSRRLVTDLFSRIDELGALTTAVDVIFAEPDHLSPLNVADDLRRTFDAPMDLSRIPPEYLNYDSLLAGAIAKGNFILGYSFLFEQDQDEKPGMCRLHPLKALARHGPGASSLEDRSGEPTGAVCSLPILGLAASGSGFLNVTKDLDGVIRRAPLVLPYKGEIYPSLVLATMLQYLQPQRVVLNLDANGESSLQLDGRAIPLDGQGNLLLHFRGPAGSFRTVSAKDVLEERIPDGSFFGRVVFVGSSALGLNDIHVTPLDRSMPGTEVQATILDNILRGDFFSRPAWALQAEIVATLFLGLGVALLLSLTGALWSLPAVLLGGAGVWNFAGWSLATRGYHLSPLYPMLAIILNFVLLTLGKYIREERKSRTKTRELIKTQETVLLSMASLVETRDSETGMHIQRTQLYVRALMKGLKKLPHYRTVLTSEEMDLLFKSSPLHDIGKVGVPDHILLKPGPLTREEFEEMKKHATYGYNALKNAEALLGGHSFLRLAKEIALYHHEKWDGTGYPFGLKGADIPLPGRIMALAAVYDALTSRRVYKPPISHAEAMQIILQGKGSHFDPEIVDVFMQSEQEFLQITLRYLDEDNDRSIILGKITPGQLTSGLPGGTKN